MGQIYGKLPDIHSDEGIDLNELSLNSRYEILLKKGFSVIDSIHYDYFSNDFDKDSFNEIDFNFNSNFPIEHNIFSKKEENQNEIKENDSINQQNNLIIEIENEDTKETLFQGTTSKIKSKKKNNHLGRKRKEEVVSQPESSSHSMYKVDNISVKVQRHFFNFIICFLNCLLRHLKYNKKLFKLGQEVKLNIKKKNLKKNVESLNDKTIEYIISNKISTKYKSDINSNKNICEEMKKNPKLNKILSENYLTFFKTFYYSSDSYANILRDYDLDIKDKICFKNVKNFKDFLNEHKNRGNMYIMSIKKVVLKNYLPGSIFICIFDLMNYFS